MSASTSRQAVGKRTGADTALSDFSEYVERKYAQRGKPSAGPSGAQIDVEDELSIIDQLGLGDPDPAANQKLRSLLLPSPEEDASAKEVLKGMLKGLVAEGRGETLFDVGLERSGDNMGLNEVEYRGALEQLREVAKGMDCAVTVLLEQSGNGAGVEGRNSKVLVRRQPKGIEELLEIRVAVVGNGRYHCLLSFVGAIYSDGQENS